MLKNARRRTSQPGSGSNRSAYRVRVGSFDEAFAKFVPGFSHRLLIASLGSVAYDERVTTLMGGTMLEQAGGWTMQADPLSREISRWIAPYLN